MLPQHHGFLVTGEADLLLRQGKPQRGHVALSLRQVADCAGNLHCGVYEIAAGFVLVAGGAVVFLVENAGVFDGARSRGNGQN